MRPRVTITAPVDPEREIPGLASIADLVISTVDRPLRTTLLRDVEKAQGLLCFLTDRIDRTLLRGAPELKVISTVSAGFDNIDVPAATARGILVTHTPDVLTETTADLAFALLLAAARNVAWGDRYVRKGCFEGWSFRLLWGVDVFGKTLGLIGAGRIGQAVARRASGFGMKILYTSRRKKTEFERTTAAQRVARDTLLRESDFISIHCALNPETRHMMGAREFGRMKPGTILINTARGAVVEEAALVAALRSGRLAAAGLDVYEREPHIPKALLKMDNVVLLPHLGSATRETRMRMLELAARDLSIALQGGIPTHVVNREVLATFR